MGLPGLLTGCPPARSQPAPDGPECQARSQSPHGAESQMVGKTFQHAHQQELFGQTERRGVYQDEAVLGGVRHGSRQETSKRRAEAQARQKGHRIGYRAHSAVKQEIVGRVSLKPRASPHRAALAPVTAPASGCSARPRAYMSRNIHRTPV